MSRSGSSAATQPAPCAQQAGIPAQGRDEGRSTTVSDVRDRPAPEAGAPPPQPPSETALKSYRYLRITLVALLVALATAVFYQSGRQDFHLLSSVSAYYYTPAQAIFVGALLGMAACMIALKGTTGLEDLFLNLGGMFAAVVAVVPTSRGQDYEAAVRACKATAGPLLTDQASGRLDCPTVQALADATRANVQNNMFSLLVVGFLGLLVTALLGVKGKALEANGGVDWRGFGVAGALFLAIAVTFSATQEWFVGHAHFVAAAGLFVCIVVVVVQNIFRHRAESGLAAEPGWGRRLFASSDRGNAYVWIARLMVPATIVVTLLWGTHVISLFWLEIFVAFFFAAFWTTQTVEQLGKEN
jgi:hypothetical protein